MSDWNFFKNQYANIAGAREEFEKVCETLFRKLYAPKHVSQMNLKVGDGGIDVFVGEFGQEPITVIQCKFFLDNFGNSQKQQIRESFETAYRSQQFELKEWILCIPRVIDSDENSWWFKWKNKKINEYSLTNDFIKIINGNEIIHMLKENDLYNITFKLQDSIKIDRIYEQLCKSSKSDSSVVTINSKHVLFNNYSVECEDYYKERSIDLEFSKSLKLTNLWIFGCSGKGKTALVNRNLIKENIKYCFCDLSPIKIESSSQVLEEILFSIEDKFNKERDLKNGTVIKQITYLLSELQLEDLIIVIDELSVSSNDVFKQVAEEIARLVLYFNNTYAGCNLKFVISTISNPVNLLKDYPKANEYFEFIQCDDWSDDIDDMFDLLTSSLNIDIDEYKDDIIVNSFQSPRKLKNILRKILLSENINSDILKDLIKKCNSEIV